MTMAGKPFFLSVKALVRNEQGRYLVLKRSAASKNHAGLWDLPGGKIDPGEAFDEALAREVREETGLRVVLQRVLGAGQSEMSDRMIAYLFMEARSDKGEARLSEEHDALAWLTTAELAAAELCPQFRSFAQTLAASTLEPA
jgi:8-oxo-dGTP diphosphatase